MLAVVPAEETLFIEMLNEARQDAVYKAPEEVIQWKRTAIVVNNFINPPTKDWEFEVLSIFTTLSVDQLKADAKARIQTP